MQSRRLLVAAVLVAATLASITWDRWARSPANPSRPRAVGPTSEHTAATPQHAAEDSEASTEGSSDPVGSSELATLIPDPEERDAVLRTLELIESGGPYPHRRNGIVFRNRERLLPVHGQRYYREYTVPTPGARRRGARRLVIGRGGEVYYTRDHYASFIRIDSALGKRFATRSRRRQ